MDRFIVQSGMGGGLTGWSVSHSDGQFLRRDIIHHTLREIRDGRYAYGGEVCQSLSQIMYDGFTA